MMVGIHRKSWVPRPGEEPWATVQRGKPRRELVNNVLDGGRREQAGAKGEAKMGYDWWILK